MLLCFYKLKLNLVMFFHLTLQNKSQSNYFFYYSGVFLPLKGMVSGSFYITVHVYLKNIIINHYVGCQPKICKSEHACLNGTVVLACSKRSFRFFQRMEDFSVAYTACVASNFCNGI